MQPRKPLILLVEDERSLLDAFSSMLETEGYEVMGTSEPDEAVAYIEGTRRIDLLISDIQLPMNRSKRVNNFRAQGGKLAGLEIARLFRKRFSGAPVLFWTFSDSRELRKNVREIGNARLVSKRMDASSLLDFAASALEGFAAGSRPRVFIVHGHDDKSVRELTSFIKKELGFPSPIVLKKQASAASTLMEKIEQEATNVDIVFVLFTPDDRVVSGEGGEVFHARQNVLFELGLFMGILGRQSGSIVLLYKKPVELPSDMGGLVPIDITNGVKYQEALIRAEVAEWL